MNINDTAKSFQRIKKNLSFWGWFLIAIMGLSSFIGIGKYRGEEINALWIVIASVCVFSIAYRFHSKWLMTKVLMVDETRIPPSKSLEDGKDFIPTNKWVVFGHHFAAIAGPGPLVGPVLAAQFGYLPGMLWILIGAVLGGAVHDSIILFCSIRRQGKSLGQMIREEIGPVAGFFSLVGVLVIMVILLAVLAMVVVKALAESPWGLFTVTATVPIAMVMGLAMKSNRFSLRSVSLFGFIGLLLSVYAGRYIQGSIFESTFTLNEKTLAIGLMGYGLLASVLPVWLLLAPRDYLSSFMKIGAVAMLGVAIIFLAPVLHMPSITSFIDGTGPVFAGPVFPFCFITIACSAISGFHALIASGTTPKLLENERDIRIVGYGSMVVEMLVGIMALIAACTLEPGQYFAVNMKGEAAAVVKQVTELGFPVTELEMQQLADEVGEKTMIGRTGGAPTFALGMAQMLAGWFKNKEMLAVWYHFAIMFETLFILTTIDAGTRVGRFLFQDLLGSIRPAWGRTDSLWGAWLGSLLFVGGWGLLLYQGVIDPLGGINSLWPIFGVANQLLAVIALALGTTFLIKMGQVRYLAVTLIPLIWLVIVTMSAGWMKIFSDDPRLGFLKAAEKYRFLLDQGGTMEQISLWKMQIVNQQINVILTSFLLILCILILTLFVVQWIKRWMKGMRS